MVPAWSNLLANSPRLDGKSKLVASASMIKRKTAKVAEAKDITMDASFAFQLGAPPSSPLAGVFELKPPNHVIAPETIPASVVTIPFKLGQDEGFWGISNAQQSAKV